MTATGCFEDGRWRAEMAVLACCWISDEVARQISETLQDKHFEHPSHKLLFKAVQTIIEQGETPDLVAIKRHLSDLGQVKSAGGIEYIIQTADEVATVNNWRGYVREVLNKWRLRTLAERGEKLAADAKAGKYAEAMLAATVCGNGLFDGGDAAMSAAEAIECYSPSARTGIKTGIPFLDDSMGVRGGTRGEFHVIGAETGIGKTNLITQAAVTAGHAGERVIVASWELDTDTMLRRMLQHLTGLRDIDHARSLGLEENYLAGMREIAGWDLHFWDPDAMDDPDRSVEAFIAWARQLHEVKPLDLVCMDYYQLMETVTSRGREFDDLKTVSRKLRSFHKRTQSVGLLAAQVEVRAKEQGKGWKIRSCQEAEKDAASSWILGSKEGQLKLACQKNRHGSSQRIWDVSRNMQTFIIEDPQAVVRRMQERGRASA